MKKCTKCGITKSETEFWTAREKKDSLRSWCKDCGAKWQKDNKDKVNSSCRKWYKNSPEVKRSYRLNTRYKMSLEEYDTLFKKQNGCCAICERSQEELKTTLAVDHDHISGRIRGLLCYDCNRALGLFKDNLGFLKRAVNHLSNPESFLVAGGEDYER